MSLREKAAELYIISNSEETILNQTKVILNGFAEENPSKKEDVNKVLNLLDASTLAEPFIKIYSETYTEEEMDFLIHFHKNPLAISAMAKTVQAANQISKLGETWMNDAIKKAGL